MKQFSIHYLILFALMLLPQLRAELSVKDQYVRATLVSELDGLVPGERQYLGVLLDMDPHWHTYWEFPGDSGLETTIDWDLPAGFEAGAIEWPAPQWIEYGGLVSYAYEDEVLLMVPVDVPEGLQEGTTVSLGARVDWLMCKESCIPGSAALSIDLEVSADAKAGKYAALFEAARKDLPKALEAWQVSAVDNGESVSLAVIAPEGITLEGRESVFFTLDGLIANDQARSSLIEGRVLQQALPKSPYGPKDATGLRGVLVGDRPWGDGVVALDVDVPFMPAEEQMALLAAVAGMDSPVLAQGAPVESRGLGVLLGMALLGGLILNLMPCVFPVVSVKILGFVQQAGEDRRKILKHGLVFTFGVLVSFWVLAGALLLLRAAGQEIGWGFQLQSPVFIAVLSAILFLFGLNLSGVFEVGESLVGVGSQLQSKSGYVGSFFSGVLATVVATPCTAPFMGTALGLAISLSWIKAMTVFTALGLGMALPYLVLSAFPAYLKFLPRPGAWMETFKKALAFLLYLTVVWLAWVFGNQTGSTGMAGLLLALVLLSIAAWVWGHWGSLRRKKSVRIAGLVVAAVFALSGGWVAWQAAGFAAPELSEDVAGEGIAWEAFSPEKRDAYVAEGRMVYVDFTATWCLTCQVNKKVALANAEVVAFFKKHDVVALKGDWTRRDPVITRELEKFGRTGVPTNIIYVPGKDPVLLPEVLTPGIVLDGFE